MGKKFVDIEALNFRSAPVIASANRIGILHLSQPVEEEGPASTPGWVKIKADVGGTLKDGVVKEEIDDTPTLREPVSAAREALVAEAIKEWLRFEQGQGAEDEDPFFKFVGEMWKAIDRPDLDGKDTDVPWSAAFISFIVRHAGETFPKYSNFKFAPAHATYFHDSIKQRKAGNTSAPFWGFKLFEKSPQIGDIVGVWRESRKTFEDAEAGRQFKSHSDIIVSVRPDFVLAIGGNVRQSVSITKYEKTGAGFLMKEQKVIVLMVNQA